MKYVNDPKFSDRQVWTNCVDSDQTAPSDSNFFIAELLSDFMVVTWIGIKEWQFSICLHYCGSIRREFSFAAKIIELPHDKTNKMACVPSEDSDQPGHPPSLNRVCAVRMKKAWVLFYLLSAQRRLWSALVSTQIWVFTGRTHHFVVFVMRRLMTVKQMGICW